jgi:carbonic anhydrase/acetyltransferase-like protein (isoleucine patch superfamily)
MTSVTVHPDAWIAPGAVVRGRVTLGAHASIWFGCVLRGDLEPITIGEGTNVQDLTVVHVDRGFPAILGKRVTIGHRAIVHGAIVEDDAVVGMGAVLLSGCTVGAGALVAAGAVVTEGFSIPPGRIAAGVPAKLRGEVGEELRARFASGVASYIDLARTYREAE